MKKFLMIPLLFLLVQLYISCSSSKQQPLQPLGIKSPSQNFHGEHQLFGVKLKWETPSAAVHHYLQREIPRLQQVYQEAMDPDCYWRWRYLKQDKGALANCSNRYSLETQELDRWAQQLRQETLGQFDVRSHLSAYPQRKFRDYAGLSQGFFIDLLQKKAPVGADKNFILDFSGDIYKSSAFSQDRRFIISDPLWENLPYAYTSLEDGGLMIASSSKMLGGDIRNPQSPGTLNREIQKVVLFAHKDFSGTRLDAWATSIISGGHKILQHLWSLPQYQGMWAYLIFDQKGRPICSSNLFCQKTTGTKGSIIRQVRPVFP